MLWVSLSLLSRTNRGAALILSGPRLGLGLATPLETGRTTYDEAGVNNLQGFPFSLTIYSSFEAYVDKMATRRGVGLGAFANRNQTTQSYATHGANLRSTHLSSLQTQLSVFQSLLHTFALEHASKIKSNPTFRAEFARMCNTIGVDPLAASNVKGKGSRGKGLMEGGSFWTQILGGDMNDFYFEVAVRVVELCRETRSENGGLIGVSECRKRVARGKAIGGGLEVSKCAITTIKTLHMNEEANGILSVMISSGQSSHSSP